MKSNYSREERQKIVEEYIQSGKSQTVFAPEYGIKPNTLSAWVTKYKSAEAYQAADVIRFMPVVDLLMQLRQQSQSMQHKP